MIQMKLIPSSMKIEVRFDKYLVTLIKRISRIGGAKYNPDNKRWTIPVDEFWTFYDNVCDEFPVNLSPALKKAREAQNSLKPPQQFPYELADTNGLLLPQWTLERHQREAITHAAVQYVDFDRGSLIALAVGGGKTCVGLGFKRYLERDWAEDHRWRTLVVVPLSIKDQWEEEIHKFLGDDVQVLVIRGRTPKQRAKYWEMAKDPKWDFVVCHYQQVVSDYKLMPAFPLVICDEAHRLKNPGSKRSRMVAQYKRFKKTNGKKPLFCLLSGTFLVNAKHDGWNLLRLVDKPYGEDFSSFKEEKCWMDDYGTVCGIKYPDAKEYVEMLREVTYLKTKEELAKFLPPIIRKTIKLRAEGPQTKFYLALKAGEMEVIKKAGGNWESIDMEGMWARMRIASLHPKAVKAYRKVFNKEKSLAAGKRVYDRVEMEAVKAPEDSVKMDWLSDFLEDFDEDYLILYCPFTSVLDAIEEKFPSKKFPWIRIDGSTNGADRQKMINKAKVEGKGYFLITDALQEGANLQFCADFIFFGLPLTHSAFEQLEGRIWRTGQTKTSRIYIPLVADSIEYNIWMLLQSKKDLVRGFQEMDLAAILG